MSLARPGDEAMRPGQRAALSEVLAVFGQEQFHRNAVLARSDELLDLLAGQFVTVDDLASLLRETAALARWHRLGGYWASWLAQQLAARLESPWFGWAAFAFGRCQLATTREDLGYDSMERGYLALLEVQTPTLTEVLDNYRQLLAGTMRMLARTAQSRPYAEINPASDNAYVLFTWRDVCASIPGLRASAAGDEPTLNAALQRIEGEDDVFARVVLLRHLGYLASDRGDAAAAAEFFATALADARQAGIEAEIGHLLRSLGHAHQRLGNAEQARKHLSDAVRHDSHPVLSYWRGLDLRMLGSAWVAGVAADQPDSGTAQPDSGTAQPDPGTAQPDPGTAQPDPGTAQPESRTDQPQARTAELTNANEAYRAGREILQAHLRLSTYLPLSRQSAMQLLRPSVDNAIQVAALLSSPSDLLAEFDFEAPGDALDANTEFEAIREQGGIASATYLADRAVFSNRFQRADEDPDAYVAAIVPEYEHRRRYGAARLALTSRFDQRQQAKDIAGFLSLDEPDVVFLHFAIGDSQLGACFSDGTGSLLSFGTVQVADSQLRSWHAAYAQALPPPDLLARGVGVDQAERALDDLLSAYAQLLTPMLTPMLDRLARKQLKVFPRSFLNQLPLHALPIAGARLIDICDVSYAQSIGLLMRAHRNPSIDSDVNVVSGAKVTLLNQVASRFAPTGGSLLTDPDIEGLSAAVADMRGHLIFTCHGRYEPADPGASSLQFGPGGSTSMASLFGRLQLDRLDAVVMAACESALGRAEISSEFIGLANVFAAAGVRYVIGSLWRVNQFASALLLDRYVGLLATHVPPAALNQAQREVAAISRDELAAWVSHTLAESASALLPQVTRMAEHPFAHPRFWSGFYLQGDV